MNQLSEYDIKYVNLATAAELYLKGLMTREDYLQTVKDIMETK